MTAIAKIWLVFKHNIFKMPVMKNITFFGCISFLTVSFEISILSYSSIYNLYKNSSKKKTWGWLLSSPSKTHLTITVSNYFSALFKGKLSSDLNLIYMKSFLYSPSLPSLILLIRFSTPSQTSVYFVNTSLFLSIEAKVFISITFFNLFIYFTNNQMQWINTINIFIITNTFHYDISDIINTNVFVWLFVFF